MFWGILSYWILSANETVLLWHNRFFRWFLFDRELIDVWRCSLVDFFFSSIKKSSDVRRLVDGEKVFLTLSNIVLNEPLFSISIISSGVDANIDSWCIINDVFSNGKTDSWSGEVRVVDDDRLRSRFNASNGRAKS